MTETLLTLFLPIILGYILVKIKYLNVSISSYIKLFVIRVAVPCRIFTAMYDTDLGTIKQILPMTLSFIFMTLFLIFTTNFIFKKIKDSKVKASYIIAISFANYGYMGWAVLDSALGPEGLARGIFFNTLWWPGIYLGTFLIGKLTKIESALNVKDFLLNIIVPSGVLILGILFNVFGIPIYKPVLHTFTVFGDMTVTLILFSVGLTISISSSFKGIKSAIIPVITRPILGIISGILAIIILGVSDPISRSAILIDSTMPTAVLSVLLGDMLGLNDELLSSILVLSTLLSLLTIPLTLYFFR